MRDLVGVIRDATAIFTFLRLRYVIVGGVAANLLGRGRSTFDVDVIAEFRTRDAARLVEAFARRGFRVSREDIEAALLERGHFSISDLQSDYRIDCKGAYTVHERRALAERRRVRLGRTSTYIDAPENLIVTKLLFGSEQDVLDAEAVYVRQRPRLNLRCIAARARGRGVLGKWKALRRRIDPALKEKEG